MTGITFIISRAIDRGQVALFALDSCVHAYQWKSGQVMVEKDFIVPAFLVVAIIALLALFSSMNIIFLVAVDAVGFEFVFFEITLVAE
jgi:hypothetical protein